MTREEIRLQVAISVIQGVLEAKHGVIGEVVPSVAVAIALRIADAFVEEWYRETKKQGLSAPEDIAAAYQMGLAKGRNEQRIVEWSKEDEKMLERIIERGQSQIQILETGLTPEQVSWLKSLRFKLHWKPGTRSF